MFELNEVKRKPNTSSTSGVTASAAKTYAVPGEIPQGDLGARAGHSVPPSVGINPATAQPTPEIRILQSKLPVITGEALYKGMLNLDGAVSGQLGGTGGCLNVRQRSRSFVNEPEFSGEITFRDMIRVNGHIAGSVRSQKGTLIVDISARVDANIDVAVAVISGTVTGDIVAHQRVEIGPNAKIYGNIWTRSIEIKHGAIFEGVCTMIANEQIAG